MDASLIICSVDDGRFARTVAHYTQALAGAELEILRIPDAKSLAEGYNRGVKASKGRLIFMSHDDVEFAAPRLWERLRNHMEHCDVLGVAGTRYYAGDTWGLIGVPFLAGQVATPGLNPGSGPFAAPFSVSIFGVGPPLIQGVQATDGLFMAARREVFEKLDFDAATFDGFHAYDLDFTYRAYRSGLRVAIATDLAPIHGSFGTWNDDTKKYYRLLDEKHRATFPARIQRQYRFSVVQANDHAELLSIMLPAEYPPSVAPALARRGLNIMGVTRDFI